MEIYKQTGSNDQNLSSSLRHNWCCGSRSIGGGMGANNSRSVNCVSHDIVDYPSSTVRSRKSWHRFVDILEQALNPNVKPLADKPCGSGAAPRRQARKYRNNPTLCETELMPLAPDWDMLITKGYFYFPPFFLLSGKNLVSSLAGEVLVALPIPAVRLASSVAAVVAPQRRKSGNPHPR